MYAKCIYVCMCVASADAGPHVCVIPRVPFRRSLSRESELLRCFSYILDAFLMPEASSAFARDVQKLHLDPVMTEVMPTVMPTIMVIVMITIMIIVMVIVMPTIMVKVLTQS
jgi:hypothetical protein